MPDVGSVILVIVGALFAGAGATFGSFLTVGPKVARAQDAAIAQLNIHMAELDVRLLEGVTATLNRHADDISQTAAEVRDLPCHRHESIMGRVEIAMDRLEKRLGILEGNPA